MSKMSATSSTSNISLNSSNNVELTDFVAKFDNLKRILSDDLFACDAKWTLFVGAALSYRYDSQLKPFPPKFLMNANQCDIEALTNVINETPALNVLLYNLEIGNCDFNVEVIDLIHWVLVEQTDSSLKTLHEVEFDSVLGKVPFVQKCLRPTYVFEVCSASDSRAEEKFLSFKNEGYATNFAFHGSKFDNFYSILNHGLQQHMCKNALFGEGIYLSSELGISLNFSPYGAAWGLSNCGSIMSCVAICEYVEHPKHLSCHIKDNKKNKVPDKYFVISNNEIVRIRYLMLFAKPSAVQRPSQRSLAISWINRNKFILSMCFYVLFLATIGIANNGYGMYLRHIIKKNTNHLVTTFKQIFNYD